MKTFIKEFRERCNDVHDYLNLLEFMDSIATNKRKPLRHESYEGNAISYLPNRECQKILRAIFYLVLYNLVESTINTIISVFKDTINDESIPLTQLDTRVIHLDIEGRFKDVTSQQTMSRIGKDLMQRVLNNEPVLLDKMAFNTSGNVDYDNFQKIVGRIGCIGMVCIDKNKIRKAMERTKKHRNKLTHGNWSFSTAGSMLVISEIKEDYECIVDFLSQSLDNFEIFIDKKKYLKGVSNTAPIS